MDPPFGICTVDSEMFAQFLILRILRMALSPQNLIPANKASNMYDNVLGMGKGSGSAKITFRNHANEAESTKLRTRKYFRIYSSYLYLFIYPRLLLFAILYCRFGNIWRS